MLWLKARGRAETAFSEEAVVPQILEMYEAVMKAGMETAAK